MKRQALAYTAAVVSLTAVVLSAPPCHGQLFKQLEQGILGGQGQGQGQMQGMPGQGGGGIFGQQGNGNFGQQGNGNFGQQNGANLLGNVNLPPAQYMMTNMQTGQAFYVNVQNGQMFLSNQTTSPQAMAPGQMMPQQQGGGLGGIGNFLKNEFQHQQAPAQTPDQQ